MSSKIPDPQVGLKEAVQLLHVSEQTARAMADRGELPCTVDVNGHRKFKFSDLIKFNLERERLAKEAARKRRAKLEAREARRG